MKVEQINVGNILKNYIYVIHSEKTKKAWVIDPYDAKQVERFLDSNNYSLEMVINTHLHFDHIKGNDRLLKKFNIPLWDIHNPKNIDLEEEWSLEVFHSPGHTNEHVIFILMKGMEQIGFFAGDTIFHNGVGNCKNGGNVEALYKTLQNIKSKVSPQALFYTGHDYGISNLKFSINQENNEIYKNELKRFESSANRVFPFGRELDTNIFLKATKEEFSKLRMLRDKW